MFKFTTKSTLIIPTIGISAILGYGFLYYQHHSSIAEFFSIDSINFGVSLSEDMVNGHSATITSKGSSNDKITTTTSPSTTSVSPGTDPAVSAIITKNPDPVVSLTLPSVDPAISLTPQNSVTLPSVDPVVSTAITQNPDPAISLTPQNSAILPSINPALSTPQNPVTSTSQLGIVPQTDPTQALSVDPNQTASAASTKAYKEAVSKELNDFISNETITTDTLNQNILNLATTHPGQDPSIIADMQGKIDYATNIRNFRSQIQTISEALHQLKIQKTTKTEEQLAINKNYTKNQKELEALVEEMQEDNLMVEKHIQDKIEEQLVVADKQIEELTAKEADLQTKYTKAFLNLGVIKNNKITIENQIKQVASQIQRAIKNRTTIHHQTLPNLQIQHQKFLVEQNEFQTQQEEQEKKVNKLNSEIDALNLAAQTVEWQKLKNAQKTYKATLDDIEESKEYAQELQETIDEKQEELEEAKLAISDLDSKIDIKTQEQQELEKQVKEEEAKMLIDTGKI